MADCARDRILWRGGNRHKDNLERDRRMKSGTEMREEVLDEIKACVCRDRQNSYGDAEDNFEHIRELWGWWLYRRGLIDCPDRMTRLDVAQMSAMIKIARKVNNLTYLDNWVDDAGYNVCGGGMVKRLLPDPQSLSGTEEDF
jgi:hypothetical protein